MPALKIKNTTFLLSLKIGTIRFAQWTKEIPIKDFVTKIKQIVCELQLNESDKISKKVMTDKNGKVLAEVCKFVEQI